MHYDQCPVKKKINSHGGFFIVYTEKKKILLRKTVNAQCTYRSMKQKIDNCFNRWFWFYLSA